MPACWAGRWRRAPRPVRTRGITCAGCAGATWPRSAPPPPPGMAPRGAASGGGARMGSVADPAGAMFGVWTPGAHRGAQRINEPSAYAMSFLRTPDPEGAKAFYGAVLGWTTEVFGPMLLWRLRGYVGGVPEQPVP